MMKVLETERLLLRRIEPSDAPYILELLNDPAFIRFIGDRGVRSLEAAGEYIANGPLASYDRFGFGLYMTELKHDGTPIGMCGLLKRDTLDDVDIGFAFSEPFRGKGYALESVAAVLDLGRNAFNLRRIVAIVSPQNTASSRLLEKLGFRFERMVRMAEDADEILLLARES